MYYSKLKIFHHRDKLDSFKTGEVSAPVNVRIKPTNRCNHNCSYCSYQNSYGQLGKDMEKQDSMPADKLMEVIADCDNMGVKAVIFSGGGEPLVYPGIDRVLDFVGSTNVKSALLTNGVLLKDKIAESALKACSWIRISMDGWDRKSYSEYRRCKEADFDTLMANLASISTYTGDCVVGVNIIIDRKNADHVYDMVKMVHDLGIKSIKVSPCIISNKGRENNEYHQDLLGTAIEQVAKVRAEGIEIYNSYHLQLEGFQKNYHWCPYIQIVPIIGADCNVYTCHDKAYNKDTGLLGSIKDQSFKDFWFNGRQKFYKIDPSKHCNHHCVIDAGNRMLIEYLDVEHKEFA